MNAISISFSKESIDALNRLSAALEAQGQNLKVVTVFDRGMADSLLGDMSGLEDTITKIMRKNKEASISKKTHVASAPFPLCHMSMLFDGVGQSEELIGHVMCIHVDTKLDEFWLEFADQRFSLGDKIGAIRFKRCADRRFKNIFQAVELLPDLAELQASPVPVLRLSVPLTQEI